MTANEIIETTKDFILKELSKRLKGYDLELFVADLLRAMGYRAYVSSHGGDRGYGFFVTLSDYTKNARQYFGNTPIIRGINGAELVELVLKYYDLLSDKYKKIIPLKMVYISVAAEDDCK